METVVLTAISVAISTRLPMMANMVICAAIYVLGHLVPILADSAVGKNEYVQFVADLQSAIFPVLDHFNISAGISAGVPVPWDYIAVDGVYCVLYSTRGDVGGAVAVRGPRPGVAVFLDRWGRHSVCLAKSANMADKNVCPTGPLAHSGSSG